MDGWVRKVGALLLLAMLLSLQLGTVQETKALTANNSSVTFRRTVVAWYDDTGKLQMNVTWVNKTIDFANLTNASCACHNSSSCSASNLTANFNVSVVTLYNMTRKHEQLLFFGISFYNSTFNYTMYALVYKAERSQYNFTLITRIFTDPKTGEYRVFLTGMNIAPNDEDRALPVGDTIITADNLTLSEYYWTLNKVLMKLRRGDETNWIWGRSAYELRHLSHLVKLKLPEYNQEKARGINLILDSEYLLYAPNLGLFVIKIYCGDPVMPIAYVYVAAYGALIAIVAECGTVIGCIAGSLGTVAATRGLCGYWKVCLTIGGFYTLSCTYA
ncbi:hypothetical protein [Thermococcus barossii]|uniref:hypothetical protein n=1 Tax=Thermococcus barossii TaxID=54077 RepID=UPI001E522059|nr:hypothetical protein [Thermococcus barossii]